MGIAVVLIVVVPLALAASGIVLIVQGVRGRSTEAASAPATLRIIAGSVLVAAALISIAGLVVEVPYAVVGFPFLAMALAAVVAAPLVVVAGVLERRGRVR